MELDKLVSDIADAVVTIDATAQPCKAFQHGVGPYGEPQLVRMIAANLALRPEYAGLVATKRNLISS